MLRITTNETPETVVITLEGRIAGPWAAELSRVWVETAPRLASRKLSLDLRNVTYADVSGETGSQGNLLPDRTPSLLPSTPWTQYLAEVIKNSSTDRWRGGGKCKRCVTRVNATATARLSGPASSSASCRLRHSRILRHWQYPSSYPANMILFSEKEAARGHLRGARGRGKALDQLDGWPAAEPEHRAEGRHSWAVIGSLGESVRDDGRDALSIEDCPDRPPRFSQLRLRGIRRSTKP